MTKENENLRADVLRAAENVIAHGWSDRQIVDDLVVRGVLQLVNMGYESYEGGRFPLYRVVLP